ncbi:Putative O-methyltransferase/MSMEI_4947 [Clostridiales bacterium CHKCI001]|nr:Putative O-methyltransferase/MSMEI_4947 [Clostridiales bacterium CHKCI001]
MITNERMIAYINSLESPESPICEMIRKEALAEMVPIIRNETASLLKFFIRLTKPMHILEVGTAVGYSAILMSEYMPEEAHITTIEKYEPRIPIAKENFHRAGKENAITLLEGDAAEILRSLEESYDLIFMDAAKGQYIHFFPDVMRLLASGGLLISDNILQDGDIIESRFAVTRRNRTIHSRMREYLYTLKHTPELQTAIIPIGDGVAVSTKQ